MNVIDKFLDTYNYKFKAGVFNPNDKDDLLLLEKIIHEIEVEESQHEEDFKEIANIIKSQKEDLTDEEDNVVFSSSDFDGYGDINKIKPKDKRSRKFMLYFKNVGSKDSNTRVTINKSVAELFKTHPEFSDIDISGIGKKSEMSSTGGIKFNYKGDKYELAVKGGGGSLTDTDQKEGLVVILYYTDFNSKFELDNYEERIDILLRAIEKGPFGLDSGTIKKLHQFFINFLSTDKPKRYIDETNQTLSAARTIRDAYPNSKNSILRNAEFDKIRKKASEITKMPSDKWNPGDIYVWVKGAGEEPIIKEQDMAGGEVFALADELNNVEPINELFNDEWGSTEKPLTSVSLKQESAQGGKAKTLLKTYAGVEEDYNLTNDERKLDGDSLIDAIGRARNELKKLNLSTSGIEYDIEDDSPKALKDAYESKEQKTTGSGHSFLLGKFAALKSILYLFKQFPDKEVDNAIVALVGFALSLTGVNPTFFKVEGQKSGEPKNPTKFARGENIMIDYEGDVNDSSFKQKPIKMTDTINFGGLKLTFEIRKTGEIFHVILNARNNGTTQGTLEIQKIKKIGDV